MHYRAVSTKLWQKVANIAVVIFGITVMGYTTTLTVMKWVHGKQERVIGYCDTL